MSIPPSPVVASWELALRLRKRREDLGLRSNDVARQLGIAAARWSSMENQHRKVSKETLGSILDIFEFDDQERRQLLDLHKASQGKAWWHEHSAVLDNNVQKLFGFEVNAEKIHAYDSLLIPGLLQTEDYIRAVMRSDRTIREVEIEQRVRARLRRQEQAWRHETPRIVAVLSEAALMQNIGGIDVRRGQLDHLLRLAEQRSDKIEIRVIPFFASEACILFGAGTLCLLDFASPCLPRVAWHETVTVWGFITDTAEVRDISDAVGEAIDRAASLEETRWLIDEHRATLD